MRCKVGGSSSRMTGIVNVSNNIHNKMPFWTGKGRYEEVVTMYAWQWMDEWVVPLLTRLF
jgi:hypothetical protein